MSTQTAPPIETAVLYLPEEQQARLNDRERFIVAARASGLSYVAIADQLGVTPGRVSQIVARPDVRDALRREVRIRTEEQDIAILEWWPDALKRLKRIALKGKHREAIQAIREVRQIQSRQAERGGTREENLLQALANFLQVNFNVFASKVPPDPATEADLLGVDDE